MRVVLGDTDRLAVRTPAVGAGLPPSSVVGRGDAPRLLALGLATVDLERAADALGGLVERLPDDRLLGARAARPAEPGILLLEPATEGRLAAALARRGEGPAAVYLEVDERRLAEVAARLREQGETMTEGAGPFGRQHLVRGGPPWGPGLVLVAGPGPC